MISIPDRAGDDRKLGDLTIAEFRRLVQELREDNPPSEENPTRRSGSSWDRTPKGDDEWLETRARTLGLIKKNGAIRASDRFQDPLLAEQLVQTVQFWRAVDQHLVPNRPRGDDGIQIFKFTLEVGTRQVHFVTRKDWLHCALSKALERVGVRDPRKLRELRAANGAAEGCVLCQRARRESPQVVLTGGDV